MQFVLYSEIEAFIEETLPHLEKDEAINNLMLGIALQLQKTPASARMLSLLSSRMKTAWHWRLL